jgi:hypothetical protein
MKNLSLAALTLVSLLSGASAALSCKEQCAVTYKAGTIAWFDCNVLCNYPNGLPTKKAPLSFKKAKNSCGDTCDLSHKLCEAQATNSDRLFTCEIEQIECHQACAGVVPFSFQRKGPSSFNARIVFNPIDDSDKLAGYELVNHRYDPATDILNEDTTRTVAHLAGFGSCVYRLTIDPMDKSLANITLSDSSDCYGQDGWSLSGKQDFSELISKGYVGVYLSDVHQSTWKMDKINGRVRISLVTDDSALSINGWVLTA